MLHSTTATRSTPSSMTMCIEEKESTTVPASPKDHSALPLMLRLPATSLVDTPQPLFHLAEERGAGAASTVEEERCNEVTDRWQPVSPWPCSPRLPCGPCCVAQEAYGVDTSSGGVPPGEVWLPSVTSAESETQGYKCVGKRFSLLCALCWTLQGSPLK